MTDCTSIRVEFAAYLAGELVPLAAARVEAHVARCALCSTTLEALASGLAAARSPMELDDKANAAIDSAIASALARAGAMRTPQTPHTPPTPQQPPEADPLDFGSFALVETTPVPGRNQKLNPSSGSSASRGSRGTWRRVAIAASATSLVAGIAVALLVEVEVGVESNPSERTQRVADTGAAQPDTQGNGAREGEAPSNSPAGQPLESRVAELASLRASEPLPGLRMLAHPDWHGRTERQGDRRVVVVENGFAAFAYAPERGAGAGAGAGAGGADGRGRPVLLVKTKAVDIEVIGTRFVVDVRDGVTTVAVASGRVKLMAPSGPRELEAGLAIRYVEHDEPTHEPTDTVRALDADLAAILDDESLRLFEQRDGRTRKPARSAAACAADAQRAAGDGEPERAVELYRRCVDEAPAALRDVIRYEMARIEAFTLKRTSGQETLARLARSKDAEVARQASLSTCELVVESDACAARACLDRLSEGADAVLADSARRLVGRWGLADKACER